jgi:hypothetical protein
VGASRERRRGDGAGFDISGGRIRRHPEEAAVKYLIMIYSNPESRKIWEGFSDDQRAEGLKLYAALHEDLAASGELIVSEALADASLGTRVSVSDGRTMSTDGPFAETNVRKHSNHPGQLSSVTIGQRAIPSITSGLLSLRDCAGAMAEHMFERSGGLGYDAVMGASLPSTRREFERARFEQLAARALRTNGASPSEPATNPMCSRCGRKNDPQATFCDRCGKALHRGRTLARIRPGGGAGHPGGAPIFGGGARPTRGHP